MAPKAAREVLNAEDTAYQNGDVLKQSDYFTKTDQMATVLASKKDADDVVYPNDIVVEQPKYITIEDFYNSDDIPTDPVLKKKLKRKITKNLILISIVFMLVFTAFNGLGSLQSSLHIDEGMGTVTMSVSYASMVLSCLFIPKLMISSLGTKWTMPICILGYLSWMAANGYATWWTLIPTAILSGMAGGPLWTAQRVYFKKIAPKYAALLNEVEHVVISKLFGIFCAIYRLSTLIGAVISSTVLRPTEETNHTFTSEEIQMHCGINDCPDNNVTNPNQSKPSSTTLWTLVGIYIGITCLGMVIVCVWVDDLPDYLNDDKIKARKQVKQSLMKTAVQLKKISMRMLIPITIYHGLEHGFYGAEWTNSFVSCSLGIWMVGFVLIPASIVNASSAFLAGLLLKHLSRIHLLTFGFFILLSFQLTLIFWPLDPEKEYVFYTLAMVRGIADGIWQTQINALYGTIFLDNSEGAFANQKMWDSIGFIIAFAYSSFLCTSVKLYIMMSLSVVSMVLYYIVEWREARKRKHSQDLDNESVDTIAVDISECSSQISVLEDSETNGDKLGDDNSAFVADLQDKLAGVMSHSGSHDLENTYM